MQACRSSEFVIAAEAFMNNAGEGMGEAQPPPSELQRLYDHVLKWSQSHDQRNLGMSGSSRSFGDLLAETGFFEADLGVSHFGGQATHL